FFSAFGRLSPKFGTPIAAIALMAIMSLVVLFSVGSDGLELLLTGVMFIDGLFFVLTGAAVIILRRKTQVGDATDGYRVPLFPVIPLIFMLGMLGVVAGSYVDEGVRKAAVVGLGFIVVAAAMYAIFFREPRVSA